METTKISNVVAVEKGRDDTTEEILTEKEIQEVKREWEWHDMWYDLTEKQNLTGRLPSIYNAALNNRCGCGVVANAIIKYRMPRIPSPPKDIESATEQINTLGIFASLAAWPKTFAQSMDEYWGYIRVQESSDAEQHSDRDMELQLSVPMA